MWDKTIAPLNSCGDNVSDRAFHDGIVGKNLYQLFERTPEAPIFRRLSQNWPAGKDTSQLANES
jgi:hypothetical protein